MRFSCLVRAKVESSFGHTFLRNSRELVSHALFERVFKSQPILAIPSSALCDIFIFPLKLSLLTSIQCRTYLTSRYFFIVSCVNDLTNLARLPLFFAFFLFSFLFFCGGILCFGGPRSYRNTPVPESIETAFEGAPSCYNIKRESKPKQNKRDEYRYVISAVLIESAEKITVAHGLQSRYTNTSLYPASNGQSSISKSKKKWQQLLSTDIIQVRRPMMT